MPSTEKPRLLDFDFDFGSSMNIIFPTCERSPKDQTPSETFSRDSHQPDILRQSLASEDLKRFTRSTWNTQCLPITPEHSVSGNDDDSIGSSRRVVSYVEEETAPSKVEDTDHQSSLAQS